MICSDISEENINWAKDNVDKNELGEKITSIVYKFI